MTFTLNKTKAEQLAKELLEWLTTEENYLIKKFFTQKYLQTLLLCFSTVYNPRPCKIPF